MAKYIKRSDGLYQATIELPHDKNGKRRRKYLYAKTIREMDELIADERMRIKNGIILSNRSFDEWGDSWLDALSAHMAPQTKRFYRIIYESRLLPVFRGRKPESIRKAELSILLENLSRDGLSKSYLQKTKIVASKIMQFIVDHGELSYNPFSSVKIPNAPQNERLPISADQQELIISTWRGHRMGLPVMIMLLTGIRRGELLALTWEDIDLKRKQITINKSVGYDMEKPILKDPKTKAGIRNVPIPDILLDALIEKKSTELVCPSSTGEFMTKTAWDRAWSSYMNFLNTELGGRPASRSAKRIQKLEPFTAHQLRHTFATMLFDANVDVLTAQKILGHSNINITLGIYTALSEKKKAQSIESLNDFLDKYR